MPYSKVKLVLFPLVLTVASHLPLLGQEGYNQFYSIENLLSKELIKSVAKDEDGYLWIATDDGVLRYDGYQTQLFYSELPSVYTKAFLRKRNGQFYVLSDFGIREIVKVNDSIYFKPFVYGENVFDVSLNYPKSVFEDIHGNVWIGEFNSLIRINEDGFIRFELGEEFRSIDYHRSFSFAEDAFGNLWIAPFKGPLLFYDKQQQKLERINLDIPLTQMRAIACVKGDHLLIGAREGLLKLKIDSDQRILASDFDPRIQEISSIQVLNNLHVFLGTRTNGLFYYDFENPNPEFVKLEQVPIQDIVDLYVDHQNNEFWIAGSEDIGLFKPSIVSTILPVGQNRIETISVDDQNKIYFSTGEKLFFLEDRSKGEAKNIFSVDDNYFDRILVEDDRIWIGDAFGGVFHLDIKKGTRTTLLNGTNLSIRYLYQDKNGNKWFSGNTEGLIRVDINDQVKFYPGLPQSVLTRENSIGDLYCGQNGRDRILSKYNPASDTFQVVNLTFSFDCPESISLYDFQFDDENNIWLGTDIGLLRIKKTANPDNLVERVVISGLNESEPVRALAINKEHVFFANSLGLVILKDGEYIFFNQDSGLPSRILKERGLVFDKEGNLLVATAKGMAVIGRNAIQFRQTVHPLVRTMVINGEPVNENDIQGKLFRYKSKLEAEFISLAYPVANIMYQTRIAGIDKNWSLPSSNRNLNVIGFSEGTYSLEVRARENGKLWSEPKLVTITISKPWYRTWWAILLFFSAGIVTVIAATQVHNNNLIRQKRNLQKIVEQRTAEINRQKNEIIEQQKKLIQQKEELIAKNEAVYKSQQALIEADMNYLHLKEKQLQDQIEHKNKQITTHALNILQKNETLRELKMQLEEIVKNSHKISITEIRKTVRTIDESFRLDKDWEDFKLYFEQVHTGFYSKLKINYPELTPLELRHCALIRLNLTLPECASILGISNDSIKVSRTRLRKKLNLEPNQSLTDFILGL